MIRPGLLKVYAKSRFLRSEYGNGKIRLPLDWAWSPNKFLKAGRLANSIWSNPTVYMTSTGTGDVNFVLHFLRGGNPDPGPWTLFALAVFSRCTFERLSCMSFPHFSGLHGKMASLYSFRVHRMGEFFLIVGVYGSWMSASESDLFLEKLFIVYGCTDRWAPQIGPQSNCW